MRAATPPSIRGCRAARAASRRASWWRSDGDDYGFLDLNLAAFDLTDRGVKGRADPGSIEAYVFPERGVYRSGETV